MNVEQSIERIRIVENNNATMMNTGSHLVAKNLARFKLITFDVTDTLLKFTRPPERQYAIAAQRHGCTDLNEQAIASCFRSNFKRMAREYPNFGKCSTYDWRWWWRTLVMDIFRESHAHLDPERLSRIADELIDDFTTSDCWTKTDMADEIVKTARVHCEHVGIISNFDPRLRDIICAMNLPEIDFIVTSYEVGEQKPSGRIFEHALSMCNSRVFPHEALHIGNTPHLDYMGAKQAGWSSVLVNIDSKGLSLEPEINPKHVFKNFSEFIHVLETVELKL